MAIGTSDIHKAIQSIWTAGGIDWEFKKYWSAAQQGRFQSLNDMEASPGQPFPYAVFEVTSPDIPIRMSGATSNSKLEIRDVPVAFHIFAKQLDSDTRSAKTFATDLAEIIMSGYGGHPTSPPLSTTLDFGSLLLVQYIRDYGIREGDSEYHWIIDYNFRVDVPSVVMGPEA